MNPAAAGRATGQLRRTRVLLTALFAAVTICSLAVLAVIAIQIDARSRSAQLDAQVAERAGGLARALYVDDGVLHLEPLSEDDLALGAEALAVYRVGPGGDVLGTVHRSGAGPQLSAPERAELVAAVLEEQGPAGTQVRSGDGPPVVWAAAPVYDGDRVGAVVAIGQSSGAGAAAHRRLVLALLGGLLALSCAAAAAGHLLSGRAMRPAVRALAHQEQFLADASHELRTPLAALRLLAESGDVGAGPRAVAVVDSIDHLLGALFLRARTDAGSYVVEATPLRLDQLVQVVVDELAADIRTTVVSEPVVFTGDPELLGSALRNLLHNAARHAPGSPVTVTVAPGTVTVADSGPGIPAEQRELVRRRGTSTGSGLGAGLSIASWVVEVHGGRLDLEDSPGGGLTARLVLPG